MVCLFTPFTNNFNYITDFHRQVIFERSNIMKGEDIIP